MQAVKNLEPSEYILAVLSNEERLEIALKIAREAFKQTTLSAKDIELAIKKIRRKLYEEKKKVKSSS